MRDFPLFIKMLTKGHEAILSNGSSHVGHQRAVVMQVMNTVELIGQYLTALKKMPQVGPGIMPAGIATACFVDRPMIIPIAPVFYNNSPA